MTSIELLKERHLMDCFFSSQLILMSWHLEHNSKAAQELASLDSVQIVLRFAENYLHISSPIIRSKTPG